LQSFSLGIAAGAIGLAGGAGVAHAAAPSALTPLRAGELDALMRRLATAPRRRSWD
jgi:hypothetical protein